MYNMPASFKLHGALDVARLEEAMREVVRRHEALQTSFRVDEKSGEPVQYLVDGADYKLEVVDLSGQRNSAVLCEEAVRREMQRPFQLNRGHVLMRGVLVRLSVEEHVLVVNAHHIASDGLSQRVLWSELDRLYIGESLDELSLQYSDFAAWQHELAGSERYARSLAYWKQQLGSDPEPLEMPTQHTRPVAVSFSGGSVRHVMKGLAAPMREMARGYNVTPTMLYIAFYAALLHRYTGQETILVGLPYSGRSGQTWDLIGMFVETLVIRVDFESEMSFDELLRRVRKSVLEAVDHSVVPFDDA